MSQRVTSFPPLIAPDATRLILGSMPGVASLTAGQYYAHPQNAFWRIMSAIGRFDATLPYEERVAALRAAGVALWDVLAACERSGSLDSAIARSSEQANDLAGLLSLHPQIKRIYFNGATAESTFRRHCKALAARTDLCFTRLPSTSPAHASLRFEEKCAVWREALALAAPL
ncbi:MAG: DNA-deoxyinosine glycosylase [Burkholderiales bacterium]|nr:DNA-deoxyinosine glycosylase [Burkholderiales bacterium]